MTCIVALCTEGGMWIGGDSAFVRGGDGEHTVCSAAPASAKVFGIVDTLWAVAGAAAVTTALRYNLQLPPHEPGVEDMAWVSGPVCAAVRATLQAAHLLRETEPLEASILLVYGGRIYEIDGTVNAVAIGGRYHAAGSGEDPALGALHVLEALREVEAEPERAVRMALEAAEAHRIYVRRPFTILQLAR